MNIKYTIEFLDEALEFVTNLDEKARDKIYYNLKKAQISNNKDLFKKLNVIFGSSEHYLIKLNTDCLHFGTNQRKKKLWLSQHMELKRKVKKLQKKKLAKQKN